MVRHKGLCYLLILSCLSFAGCNGMLPKEKVITAGSWETFDEVQSAFDRIVPNQTSLEELNNLKINPETNANISILNYTDITDIFIVPTSIDGFELDPSVKECILAKSECKGYEINEKSMKSVRYGNFWADLLNFKREADIIGWHFKGIILINDGMVIYKLSSGQPIIHEKVEKKNPLGPLQRGSSVKDKL